MSSSFFDHLKAENLKAFQGVKYKNILYQIESVFEDDDSILIRNYPFTPGALDYHKNPESEIKLYLSETHFLSKKKGNAKRKQLVYRFGYLAHFFYLGGTNAEIDKTALFQTMCPNAVFISESDFVKNMMDILCYIGIYFKVSAITLQDEAKNKNGFPLCENRFRKATYIGTYEKYGFIRDKIDYADNGNEGNRRPLEPKTPQDAVDLGNQEMKEDYLRAQSHDVEIEVPNLSIKKKRKNKKDDDIDTITVHSDYTLEELVSQYYSQLSTHVVPKPPAPCNCFGGRVKYFSYLPDEIFETVNYNDNLMSPKIPRGIFVLDSKKVHFEIINNILEIVV